MASIHKGWVTVNENSKLQCGEWGPWKPDLCLVMLVLMNHLLHIM